MKKDIELGIVIFLIIVALFSIILLVPKPVKTKEIELKYMKDEDESIHWVFEIEDPSIVEFVKSYEKDEDDEDSSIGDYTYYVFRGLKKGKTIILFKLIKDNDVDNAMAFQKNTVIVDDEKYITLRELK